MPRTGLRAVAGDEPLARHRVRAVGRLDGDVRAVASAAHPVTFSPANSTPGAAFARATSASSSGTAAG